MSVEVAQDRLTYEQWRELPESTQPQEIIDGVLSMAPAPTSEHQWLIQVFADSLSPFVRGLQLGVVLPAPVDVVISRQPLRTRQPDLLFLSRERTGIHGRKELRRMPAIEIAPDLVVEVLSPGNRSAGLAEKLTDYQKIGVLEAWLIDLEAETVEILRLDTASPERVDLLDRGGVLRSSLIPGWSLALAELFD